eukprot:CAMPEP_0184874602 /NCGR_PEP_ID=MMETSP0580-20130426/42491_1 /TAXON_ID=1118495 /ORGANISM="Dactyliosolen fragilissimus" /LENGTH=681 /DNA_ID=CAMNT_0027377643 /DNA_START=745 /DNA_END=2787 /DNA_ORIENTATION=-
MPSFTNAAVKVCGKAKSYRWDYDTYRNILSQEDTNLILAPGGEFNIPWPEKEIIVIDKKKENFKDLYGQWVQTYFFITEAPTTLAPTESPTSYPTSHRPSSFPSFEPTSKPTISYEPSASPSLLPSQNPTNEIICVQSNSYPDYTKSACSCENGFASYELGTKYLLDEDDICAEIISIKAKNTEYGQLCIAATNAFDTVLQKCKDFTPRQQFLYHPSGYLKSILFTRRQQILNDPSSYLKRNFVDDKCLKMHLDGGYRLILESCKDWKLFQWNFDAYKQINSEYDRDFIIVPDGKFNVPWPNNKVVVRNKRNMENIEAINKKWVKMEISLDSEPTLMPSFEPTQKLTCPQNALEDTSKSPPKCFCEDGYVPYNSKSEKNLKNESDFCIRIKQIKLKNFSNGSVCLSLDVASLDVILQECNPIDTKQQWLFHPSGFVKSNFFQTEKNTPNMCLKMMKENSKIAVVACERRKKFKWHLYTDSTIMPYFNYSLVLAPRDNKLNITPSIGNTIVTIDKTKDFDKLNSKWLYDDVCPEGFFSYKSGNRLLVNSNDLCVKKYQLQARNTVNSELCIAVRYDQSIFLKECNSIYLNQQWLYHPEGYLKNLLYNNQCLNLNWNKRKVEALTCQDLGTFKWNFSPNYNIVSKDGSNFIIAPGGPNNTPLNENDVIVINKTNNYVEKNGQW